jgi:hypothetical protein
VECSASDLISQYVRQTRPKTIKLLEKGLGRVLFIDEGYRLSEGSFAQEAVNELVDTMTKPKFAGIMVIILAGYDNDMNRLLRVNEGLSSRFADEVVFPSLDAKHCLQFLELKLRQSNIVVPTMQDPATYQQILDLVTELSKFPACGNARDVQTLAKSMAGTVYQNNTEKVDQLVLPSALALNCIQTMLSERRARQDAESPALGPFASSAQALSESQSSPLPMLSTSVSSKAKKVEKDVGAPSLPMESAEG